jgi:hypothetical protein
MKIKECHIDSFWWLSEYKRREAEKCGYLNEVATEFNILYAARDTVEINT